MSGMDDFFYKRGLFEWFKKRLSMELFYEKAP
jgi:hypothetical protein